MHASGRKSSRKECKCRCHSCTTATNQPKFGPRNGLGFSTEGNVRMQDGPDESLFMTMDEGRTKILKEATPSLFSTSNES